MAGKSTISITLKLEGDDKTFKELTTDAEGLRKLFQSTIGPAENLKKSLINWSAGAQAIDAVTSSIERMSSAYSRFSERMKGAQDANIRITQLTGKTGDEMRKLRSSVQAVSEHFGADFNETLQAANALSKGFGISIDDAMKLLRDGLVSGANANGDFIDTLREYPRYFKEAGLSAEDFVAIATNAAQQGVFSDKGVDVIKEGNLRIREMTTATAAALEGIGISAEKVQEGLRSGALTTFEVMQMVAAKLNELPASSSAVGTAIADIFGGPGEDAGLEYIKTLANIELNMDAVKAATQGTAEQQERQIQMQEKMKNTLSSIIDLSSIYTDIKPWADLTAQAGMAAMGFGGVLKTVRTMTKHVKASGAAMLLFGLRMNRAAAVSRVFNKGLKSVVTSATAAKIALRGVFIGGAIVGAITGIVALVKKLSDNTKEATVAQEALSAVNKRADEEFSAQAATIDRLNGVLKSETATLEQKKAALAELQSIVPDYHAKLDAEGKLINNNTEAVKNYLAQLEKEIKLKAAQEELEELYRKKRLQEKQKKEAEKEYGSAKSLYNSSVSLTNSALQNRGINTGVKVFAQNNAGINALKSEADRAKRALDEVNGSLSETLSSIEAIEKEIEQESAGQAVPGKLKELQTIPTTQGLGGSSGSSAENQTKSQPEAVEGLIGKLEQQIAGARERLNKATSEAAIEAINKEIAAYEKELGRYKNLGVEIGEAVQEGVDSKKPKLDANASTLRGFEENIRALNEELQTADMGRAAELNREIALWNEKAEAIRNAGKEAEKTSISTGKALLEGWNGIKGIGSSIEGITDALKGNGNAWQAVTGIVDGFIGLYQSFERIVQIINALTGVTNMLAAAKQGEAEATTQAANAAVAGMAQEMAASAAAAATKTAETNANVSAAASGALAAHAGIPFVGIALGLAAVASIIAAMASLPKFAKGGIVSGPTLAMVGEYAGASGNPEVIAPLDKLRGMLAPSAGTTDFSKVRFEIKGRTLVGILAKENEIVKRN